MHAVRASRFACTSVRMAVRIGPAPSVHRRGSDFKAAAKRPRSQRPALDSADRDLLGGRGGSELPPCGGAVGAGSKRVGSWHSDQLKRRLGSNREGLAAAALAALLRVQELEALLLEGVDEVERGAVQVEQALGVDVDLRPGFLEDAVLGARLVAELDHVRQARAAASLDAQPDAALRTRLRALGHLLADLLRGLGGQVDGGLAHAYSALRSWGWATAGSCSAARFFFQSAMAALMASSASTEQWIFTGGSDSSCAICVFLMVSASSTDLPFTHSVTSELEAIAEPQPKVLNLASWILPSSPILT